MSFAGHNVQFKYQIQVLFSFVFITILRYKASLLWANMVYML